MSSVSRETQERLDVFEALVRKWSPKINLVSRNDLKHLTERHINDSIQLFHVKQDWTTWLDVGSGGGFPGLITAILAAEQNPIGKTILVESDGRKSTFLRTVVRELSLNAEVKTDRIEDLEPFTVDILSARAFAPLARLFSLTEHVLGPETTAILPKGKNWREEVKIACQEWSFQHEVIESQTAPDAVILKIREVKRV